MGISEEQEGADGAEVLVGIFFWESGYVCLSLTLRNQNGKLR